MIKKVVTAKGKEMFFQDGKLIAKSKVPAEFFEESSISEPTPLTEDRPDRKCIFCGAPGRFPKFVHLQTVYLCEEDITIQTVGKIGYRIKELGLA